MAETPRQENRDEITGKEIPAEEMGIYKKLGTEIQAEMANPDSFEVQRNKVKQYEAMKRNEYVDKKGKVQEVFPNMEVGAYVDACRTWKKDSAIGRRTKNAYEDKYGGQEWFPAIKRLAELGDEFEANQKASGDVLTAKQERERKKKIADLMKEL